LLFNTFVQDPAKDKDGGDLKEKKMPGRRSTSCRALENSIFFPAISRSRSQ
jgi:hypothetical protein